MRPFEVRSVTIEHVPGHPSLAAVELGGGIRLDRIQVWPARHGPLVLFPMAPAGHFQLGLTPVLRSLLVRAVVAAWRQSWSARVAA